MPYKRKYRRGEAITSLDELAKQEFVYFFDKITHRGWFMSWQFSLAEILYYAEKIGEKDDTNNTSNNEND